MKIVISDDYQDCVRHLNCFNKIQHHDLEIFNDTVSELDAKVERFKDAEAIVLTRERTVIDSSLLKRLPKLKLISQTGKIASHIDLTACKEHGVVVMDGRGSGSATAELNLLLILAALRNIVPEVNRLQSGKWQGTVGRQLSGKLLGVYGFGRIGQQICKLGQAFGARVLVWGRESSLIRAKEMGFEVATSKENFFSTSDIISLQLRLNPETVAIVTSSDLALMKSDSLLVNTSRAELIERGALYAGLKQGHPGFAAIDVYESEPVLNAADPLLQLPNCLCTPHLGFVEKDNYEAYFGVAFDNINAFVDGNMQNRVV
jgi:D-3-phosphoglycerate dehydrogenase